MYFYPTWRELTEALKAIKARLGPRQEIDVRLNVQEGGWALLTGDACYDDDHRGLWGASHLKGGGGRHGSNCEAVATELLEQAREMEAQLS